MGNCKDCKYFNHEYPERYLHGDCNRQDVPGALYVVTDSEIGDKWPLSVHPNFGCVQFEAKIGG